MAKDRADKLLDAYLRGGSGVSKLYGAGALAGPPAALDRTILDAASKAVRGPNAFNPFGGRWYVPASAAAAIAIAVGLTLFMQREGVPPVATVGSEQANRALTEETRPLAPTGAAREMDHRRLKDVDTLGKASTPAAPREKSRSDDVSIKAKRMETESVSPASSAPEPARQMYAAGIAQEAKKEGVVKSSAADVTAVRASGGAGAYQFSVTVRSPDTGCAQYADWWEVLGEDGKLIYRRVLLHSHVDEQPFTRGGGPVPIAADTTVIVRAHMNTSGFGGAALKGSVKQGFTVVNLPAGFAADVAKRPPLPDGCAF